MFKKQNGISVVGAIFALIILGIFGAAIVSLVSAEHEFRAAEVNSTRAFYNTQAGLEFAIRKVYEGSNPEVIDKNFGYGIFTVDVDFIEGSKQDIIVFGGVGDVRKVHAISYDKFGGNCMGVNNTQAVLTGPNKSDLKGITLRRNCNLAVTIDKIEMKWEPDGGEVAKLIKIKNSVVWEDLMGLPSGSTFDITDVFLDGSVAHQLNVIEFSSSMLQKTLTMKYILSDTSTFTQTFTILPPNQK